MKINGRRVDVLVIIIDIHSLLKSCSVIPNIAITNPPNYVDKSEPKLRVLIISAYIVPSMFLGHILHANTRTGSILSSPIT
jgi:hypothetical protein